MKTALLWLASYLRQYYPVEYVDYELEIGRPATNTQIRRYERIVRNDLTSREFDILGLSCWTSLSYHSTLAVARLCREMYPDKLIVVGGYHPTAKPEEFITDDGLFDYVVYGEGEHAMIDIIERFAERGRPGKTELIKDTPLKREEFIPYNWDLVAPIIEKHASNGVDCLYLFLSRGCPFRCSFCMEPLKDENWRALSPADAVDQIMTAAGRFKIRSVGIADACFGVRPSWRHEFLRQMVEAQPPFWLIFETRPEYITDEDIELITRLKAEVQFGVESGSHRMLQLMHKSRTPQKYLDAFVRISRELSDRGIIHRGNLLFNHPGETRETLEETFAFIDSCLGPEHSTLIWVPHSYMHFPGCEVYHERERFEKNYGTNFDCGDWWLGDQDQYVASMSLAPSSSLDGEDRELCWRMMESRMEKMKQVLSPEAFLFAANKYYPYWQDDYRYQNA